jgi:hypothetical protein
MPVQLVIEDGDPHWYLSPDIWVVPGSDPGGAPGSPVAGQPAYLWAHVANPGSTAANGVRVNFYWANPALQVLRSNANLVGSAFADVAAGGGQDVLCLVPWTPVIVNGGHECLVAEAIHASDPLPVPLPDDFDPPAFRQVAQKNLTVLAMSARMMATHAITIGGWRRADKAVVVTAEVGGALPERSLQRLGLKRLRPAAGPGVEVGLDHERRCPGEGDPLGAESLEVRVARGTSAAVHLSIRARDLAPGEYHLVHVTERMGDRRLGGLAFVVIAAGKEGRS